MDEDDGGLTRSLVTRLVVGLILVATVLALVEPVVTLLDPVSRNYNEGWNALNTQRLLDGKDLYPPDDALFFNNYPPLSFHVVGAVARITDDTLGAGRIVALISLLVTVASVGVIAATILRCRGAGVFAGVLALAVMVAHFEQYVAMNDPQMLGHAFQWSALAIFLRAPESARRQWIALALLVAGGLVKHNLVAVPLAMVLWVAFERRTLLAGVLLRGVVLVAIGVGLLLLSHGPQVFAHVLDHARTFDPASGVRRAVDWLGPLWIVFAAAFFLLAPSATDRRAHALRLVVVIGLALGVVFAGGGGISYNVVFDPVLAACALAGLVPFRRVSAPVRTRARDLRRAGLVALVAAVQIVLLVPAIEEGFDRLERRPQRLATFADDAAFVAARPGPVLTGTLALAHAADKDFTVDLFNVHQAIVSGAMDPQRLIDRIARREFAVIQLSAFDRANRLTGPMLAAIEHAYDTARRNDLHGRIYLPESD